MQGTDERNGIFIAYVCLSYFTDDRTKQLISENILRDYDVPNQKSFRRI